MERKKMNAVAAMAIVLMILLSSNTITVGLAAKASIAMTLVTPPVLVSHRESTNLVMKSVGLGADQSSQKKNYR
ncbi:hypothetical protein H5410_010720 [Solanum commersonii]|uniref:Uncharacterized protein n=1 Tax=Solanum commersonii TaxID=4109 RepID=A0A9J6ALJ5_SOLCO|nr:hypothetical protein H5410_010720 [Solanum commersonii]